MAIIDNWKAKPGKPKPERKGLRWTVDYRNAAGTRRQRSFDRKSDAEEFELAERRAKQRGSLVDSKSAEKVTVFELWQSFFQRVETMGVRGGMDKGASPKTLTKYRNCFKLYIEPRFGHTPIGSIRYADVSEWITGLRNTSDEPASAYLRRETAGIFRSLMDHALRLEYLDKNPALDAVGLADYRPRAVKQKEHVYLTMAQLGLLASQCKGFETLIWTAGLCGLRFGEITALTVGDLDLGDKPMIRVNKAYTDDRGTLYLKETKTGEDRNVPLPRLVAVMLKSELAGRDSMERVWSAPRGGGAIRHGSFTKSGSRFGKAVSNSIALAGVDDEKFPKVTFHDLRHTAVSLAIKAGANVKVVQRIAGHSSATITLDTYAGLFTDDLHDSAARLNLELEKYLETLPKSVEV